MEATVDNMCWADVASSNDAQEREWSTKDQKENNPVAPKLRSEEGGSRRWNVNNNP
jgi:hypothetical protein